MKFSNWQLAIMIGGIRHETCACLLNGVGVDGAHVVGLHYFNYCAAHGMCNVHCTWLATHFSVNV